MLAGGLGKAATTSRATDRAPVPDHTHPRTGHRRPRLPQVALTSPGSQAGLQGQGGPGGPDAGSCELPVVLSSASPAGVQSP